MGKKNSISKTVFDKLSQHIEEFSAIQDQVLNNIDLVPPTERKSYQEIFRQYDQHLQRLLSEAHVNDSADESLPCVTLGSMVELEDLVNQRNSKILITFPGLNQTSGAKLKVAKTSYNSPIGKALFLKKPGDTVEVNAPGGVYRYRIKAVVWMN